MFYVADRTLLVMLCVLKFYFVDFSFMECLHLLHHFLHELILCIVASYLILVDVYYLIVF